MPKQPSGPHKRERRARHPNLDEFAEPNRAPNRAPAATPPAAKAVALAIRPAGVTAVGPVTAVEVEQAREFMAASLSESTRRAYRTDWRAFELWCAQKGLVSMPAAPETVVLYITHLAHAGKKNATIERAKSSISVAHDTANEKNPIRADKVKRTMQGIARTLGVAPVKKNAVKGDDVQALIAAAKSDRNPTRGARDAALLAIGFAGGFRRSELAAIQHEHLNFDVSKKVAVYVPKSKTDQEGRGRWVGIAHAPAVDLLRKWLAVLGRESGPVFVEVLRKPPPVVCGTDALSGGAVGDIVKKYAEACGLDPKNYAGHSLRRGFVTTAKRNGKSNEAIMRQTGHKSVEVFMGYIEEAGLFDDNASEGLWEEKKT